MRNKVLILSISGLILFITPWLWLTLLQNIANVHIGKAIINKTPYNYKFSTPYLIGIAAYENREFTKSIDILSQIDKVIRPPIRWYLAKAYLQKKNSQAAIAVLSGNRFAEHILFRRILTEYLVGLTSQEEQLWQQYVVDVYPDDDLLYATLLLTAQQFGRAEGWVRALPNYQASSQALIIIGSSYFYRGAMNEAERYFKQAYEAQPTDYSAYWYGRIFLVRGQINRALPLLQEAVHKTNSNVTIAWYLRELGTAYAKAGQCIDAYAAFDLAVQRDPSDDNIQRIAVARVAIATHCPLH